MTSLVETPFLSKLELNPTTGKYDIEGSFPDLIAVLKEKMNFTFTLEPPPDNQWGGQNPDGTWNGMMALVQNQIVDFGMLPQNIYFLLYQDWKSQRKVNFPK
jgi:hypothetical protein